MFQSAFHVNTFKPWNLHPTKPSQSHNVHKTLNSTSASSCSSPSKHKSPSTPCSPPVHNSKYHPLPARPPAEVCVPSKNIVNNLAGTPKSTVQDVVNKQTGGACQKTQGAVNGFRNAGGGDKKGGAASKAGVSSNADVQPHSPWNPLTPTSAASPSMFNPLHMDDSDFHTHSSVVEENDTCPMSSGLLRNDKHYNADTPIELPSF